MLLVFIKMILCYFSAATLSSIEQFIPWGRVVHGTVSPKWCLPILLDSAVPGPLWLEKFQEESFFCCSTLPLEYHPPEIRLVPNLLAFHKVLKTWLCFLAWDPISTVCPSWIVNLNAGCCEHSRQLFYAIDVVF